MPAASEDIEARYNELTKACSRDSFHALTTISLTTSFQHQQFRILQEENRKMKTTTSSAGTTRGDSSTVSDISTEALAKAFERGGKKFSVMFEPWMDPALWEESTMNLHEAHESYSRSQLRFKNLASCIPKEMWPKLGNPHLQRLVSLHTCLSTPPCHQFYRLMTGIITVFSRDAKATIKWRESYSETCWTDHLSL